MKEIPTQQFLEGEINPKADLTVEDLLRAAQVDNIDEKVHYLRYHAKRRQKLTPSQVKHRQQAVQTSLKERNAFMDKLESDYPGYKVLNRIAQKYNLLVNGIAAKAAYLKSKGYKLFKPYRFWMIHESEIKRFLNTYRHLKGKV